MIRVALKLAFAAAAVAALWSFVPVHGRTLAQRWRAARSVSELVEVFWADATGGPERPDPPRSRVRSQKAPASRERPSEGHTDADRVAVDRILAERLDDRP